MTYMKACTKCKKEKPFTKEFFKRNNSQKSGLNPSCKSCSAKLDANYREENAKKISLKQKKWYESNAERCRKAGREKYSQLTQAEIKNRRKRESDWRKANPERNRMHKRKWEINNPEKIRIKNKRYYEDNKNHHLLICKRWRDSNRTLRALYSRSRYALKKWAEGSHTLDDILEIYEKQKGKCAYCKKKVGEKYHIDHILPLNKGGSDDKYNICIACPRCNQTKSDKMPWVFAKQNWMLI